MSTLDHWAAGQRAMSALGRSLSDDEGERPVAACPAWTVREVFAHQAGVAADILGGRLEGVATNPWTERQVRERAEQTLAEILDEWDGHAPGLVEALTPMADDLDPRMVIDVWTHDQDVRGTLGRAGERKGERAEWVGKRFRDHFAEEVERAGLAPLVLHLDGDRASGPGLAVDRFEFCRASVGRRSPDQIRAWAWPVDDPEPYVGLVPVFPPRDTELIEKEAP